MSRRGRAGVADACGYLGGGRTTGPPESRLGGSADGAQRGGRPCPPKRRPGEGGPTLYGVACRGTRNGNRTHGRERRPNPAKPPLGSDRPGDRISGSGWRWDGFEAARIPGKGATRSPPRRVYACQPVSALRQTLEAGVRYGYLTRNPAKLAGKNPQPKPRSIRVFTSTRSTRSPSSCTSGAQPWSGSPLRPGCAPDRCQSRGAQSVWGTRGARAGGGEDLKPHGS